jgi:hypothetical protein
VLFPSVEPGVKKGSEFTRYRIDTGEVRAFLEVAAMTG